jgi:hypothetical protein
MEEADLLKQLDEAIDSLSRSFLIDREKLHDFFLAENSPSDFSEDILLKRLDQIEEIPDQEFKEKILSFRNFKCPKTI